MLPPDAPALTDAPVPDGSAPDGGEPSGTGRSGSVRAARWALRVGLLPVVAVLAACVVGRLDPRVLVGAQADLHGAVKAVLLVWQVVALLRLPRLLGMAVLAVAWTFLLPRVRSTVARAGLVLVGIVGLLLVWRAPGVPWALALALLPPMANLVSWTPPTWLFALPGMPLVLPVPAWRACSVTAPRPWVRTAALLVVAPLQVVLAPFLDARARFGLYEAELLEPWPEDRPDARVERVASSPAGLHSDFHDLDLVRAADGSLRAVVTAESQKRLLSLPDGATSPLPDWWGPMEGLVMDAETDPATGVTWTLDGPHHVVARRWTREGWQTVRRSAKLPRYVHHAYTVRVTDAPQVSGLYLFGIGLSHQLEGSWVMRLSEDLARVEQVELREAGGRPLRGIRDVVWVPPLERFVLVPDMGEQLWTWRPGEDRVMPWLAVATRNGKPTWSAAMGRLLLPAPERATLWIIDPVGQTVRDFRTQPGVRAAAIDARRGRVWTASVLTGAVMVQRLQDGAILDTYAGQMPMFRAMAVDEETGAAWIVGWREVWRVGSAE